MPPDFESVGRRAAAGVVAVVLDDLGYDERALETLARWDGPLALAVIPSAPLAGRRRGPREGEGLGPPRPSSDGARVGPVRGGGGRHARRDDVIRARVVAALATTPGAIGINNHQGSKATADPRVVAGRASAS